MQTKKKILLCAGALQIVLLALFTPPGEDISIARKNFTGGERSDFLGVFAGIFYAHIPEYIFGWNFYLALFQCILVIISLNVYFGKSKYNQKFFFLLLILQTLSLTFAAQQSRDGSLFAFMMLGFAFLKISRSAIKKAYGKLFYSFGMILLLIGLCFRPWFALPLIPLIYFLMKERHQGNSVSNVKLIIISVLLVILPIVIEFSAAKLIHAQRNYPFQLVVIHDLSAMACWSSNSQTINRATEALEVLSSDPKFATRICQYFKPSSWQSVVGSFPSTNLTNGLTPPLKITNNQAEFRKLVGNWRNLIFQDPKTFVQIKLMLSWQVLFASQTQLHTVTNQVFNNLNDDKIVNGVAMLHEFFTFPWMIVSTFLIPSPGVFLILLLVYSRFSQSLKREAFFLGAVISCILTVVSIGTLTFVSDNGRYSAPFVMLCAVLTMVREVMLRSNRVKN